ncbi:terminase small subunit [Pseudoalteromonas marina]|uniref:terminase small subunit n=1 Tax=Pseudoalteromonas marina TaxID=267375 RepID=UPI0023F0A9C8|nr:terminase small subunit [Pseudoalteromonas marina]
MAGGRPTKYNEEALNTAEDYIVNFSDYGDAIPSVVGLAVALETHRDTIYAWAKEEGKEAFSDIVKRLSTNQERRLLNGGLDNSFNPTIAKLLLGKHGYSDKQETDITSGGEKLQHPGYTIVNE